MLKQRSRRFGILDAIILIAGMAVGLALLKPVPPEEFPDNGTQPALRSRVLCQGVRPLNSLATPGVRGHDPTGGPSSPHADRAAGRHRRSGVGHQSSAVNDLSGPVTREEPMTIRDDLPTLFAYNRWADGKTVGAVRGLAPGDYAKEPAPGWASVRSTLVHMADAMTIWARRLDGQTVSTRRAEADLPTLDDAERLLREGHEAFDRLLAAVTPGQLATVWDYRNLKGEPQRAPLWAVYRHVVNHATYHRGQVAAKIKRFGVEPPATDFVFWAVGETPQS
jgi:uncharacterized damage-inducible protein DinB